MCRQCSSSTYFLGGRGKSFGSFLESLIFLLQFGCVVSPIPGCGVLGSGYESSIMYLLTITEMLLEEKYDSFD
jgi:hypothetical protein